MHWGFAEWSHLTTYECSVWMSFGIYIGHLVRTPWPHLVPFSITFNTQCCAIDFQCSVLNWKSTQVAGRLQSIVFTCPQTTLQYHHDFNTVWAPKHDTLQSLIRLACTLHVEKLWVIKFCQGAMCWQWKCDTTSYMLKGLDSCFLSIQYSPQLLLVNLNWANI